MTGRNVGARCAVLVTTMFAIGGTNAMLAAAPAAAGMSPPITPCGACAPQFTIEKFQEIAGSKAGFTTAPLIGKAGQTVDYEMVVTNTGHVPVALSEFTDAHCDKGTLEGGPGTQHVIPGSSTTYTCSRHLAGPGIYTNQATVTGETLFGTATETSNTVVVEVPSPPPPPTPKPTPAPAFTVEKSQEIAGTKAGFTAAPLPGAVGETVDYQIAVKNTGNVPLKFSGFSDAQCDQPTIAGGPGEGSVAPGASTTYACSHLLAAIGKYVNQASVTGTAQGLAPISESSNPVEVIVPPQIVVKGSCERSGPIVRGATGAKRSAFNVQVNSEGIQLLTVFLDGHKLKTFHPSQAKNGKFSLKIDPLKLSHGVHTVTIRAATQPNCKIAAASSFVRPFTAKRKPPFTG